MKAVVNQEPCAEANCSEKSRSASRTKQNLARVARFEDMLTAMGTEPRLRIIQLLPTAHLEGMVVGDIQSELEIAPSTLSHHLEKLRIEDLVTVRRDKKVVWYTANSKVLEELLSFLFAECCSRTNTVKPDRILELCK